MKTRQSLRAYVTLEDTLRREVYREWVQLTAPYLRVLRDSLHAREYARASEVAGSLSFRPLVEKMTPQIRTLGMSAILVGASRIRPTKQTTFYNAKRVPPVLEAAVAAFGANLEHRASEVIRTRVARIIDARRAKDPTEPVVSKAADDALADMLNAAVLGGGKTLVDIGANLTTSRLVTYGFLAEAGDQGWTEYQITEELDERTCLFCTGIHGAVMRVPSELARVEALLLERDPAALAEAAPFPSQSVDALAHYQSLSDLGLQEEGYGSPPYHPHCRGQLVPVGSVPDDEIGTFHAPQPEAEGYTAEVAEDGTPYVVPESERIPDPTVAEAVTDLLLWERQYNAQMLSGETPQPVPAPPVTPEEWAAVNRWAAGGAMRGEGGNPYRTAWRLASTEQVDELRETVLRPGNALSLAPSRDVLPRPEGAPVLWFQSTGWSTSDMYPRNPAYSTVLFETSAVQGRDARLVMSTQDQRLGDWGLVLSPRDAQYKILSTETIEIGGGQNALLVKVEPLDLRKEPEEFRSVYYEGVTFTSMDVRPKDGLSIFEAIEKSRSGSQIARSGGPGLLQIDGSLDRLTFSTVDNPDGVKLLERLQALPGSSLQREQSGDYSATRGDIFSAVARSLRDALFAQPDAAPETRTLDIVVGPATAARQALVDRMAFVRAGDAGMESDAKVAVLDWREVARQAGPDYNDGIGRRSLREWAEFVLFDPVAGVASRALAHGKSHVLTVDDWSPDTLKAYIDAAKEAGFTVNVRMVDALPTPLAEGVFYEWRTNGKLVLDPSSDSFFVTNDMYRFLRSADNHAEAVFEYRRVRSLTAPPDPSFFNTPTITIPGPPTGRARPDVPEIESEDKEKDKPALTFPASQFAGADFETQQRWEEHFTISPAELTKKFFEGSGLEGKLVSVERVGEGEIYVGFVLHDAETKERLGRMNRTFSWSDEGLTVTHNLFSIEEGKQGQGGAREVLANSFRFYEELGVDTVKLHANIDVGGYAWLRTGFYPSTSSTIDLADNALGRVARMTFEDPHTQEKVMELLRTARDEEMPEALVAVTDLAIVRDEAKGVWKEIPYSELETRDYVTLGKKLFLGTDWYGQFSFSDAEQRERVYRYLDIWKETRDIPKPEKLTYDDLPDSAKRQFEEAFREHHAAFADIPKTSPKNEWKLDREEAKQFFTASYEEAQTHLEKVRPTLQTTLQELRKIVTDPDDAFGRVKSPESTAGKLLRKPGREIESFTDLVGTTALFRSNADLDAALVQLKERFKIRGPVEDFRETGRDGYRAVHVIVEIDNQPVEVQLKTEEQFKWSEISHSTLYAKVDNVLKDDPDFRSYMMAVSQYLWDREKGPQLPLFPPPCPVRARFIGYCWDQLEMEGREPGTLPVPEYEAMQRVFMQTFGENA